MLANNLFSLRSSPKSLCIIHQAVEISAYDWTLLTKRPTRISYRRENGAALKSAWKKSERDALQNLGETHYNLRDLQYRKKIWESERTARGNSEGLRSSEIRSSGSCYSEYEIFRAIGRFLFLTPPLDTMIAVLFLSHSSAQHVNRRFNLFPLE